MMIPLVSDDVRTFSIKYGPNGERSRGFVNPFNIRQVEMKEFPLSPRICLEYLRAILQFQRVVTGSTCHGCRMPASLKETELSLKTKC